MMVSLGIGPKTAILYMGKWIYFKNGLFILR
jgi:hypothetical protein